MEIKFHLMICSGNFIYGLGFFANLGQDFLYSLHPQKNYVLDKFASKVSSIKIILF
jgi:hypothetical protein